MSKRTFEQAHIVDHQNDVSINEQPSKRSTIPGLKQVHYVLFDGKKIQFDPKNIELIPKPKDKFGNAPLSIRYRVEKIDKDGKVEICSIPLVIQTPELQIPFKPSTKAELDAKMKGGSDSSQSSSSNANDDQTDEKKGDMAGKQYSFNYAFTSVEPSRKEEVDFLNNFVIPFDDYLQNLAYEKRNDWFKSHPQSKMFKNEEVAKSLLYKRKSDPVVGKTGIPNPPRFKVGISNSTNFFDSNKEPITINEITSGCMARAVIAIEDLFYNNNVGLIYRLKCKQLQKTRDGNVFTKFAFVEDEQPQLESDDLNEQNLLMSEDYSSQQLNDLSNNQMPPLETS